jgi:hypothetical protein
MPRGDGTGPNGMGPMTGRAAGYCAGFVTPGAMGRGMGRRIRRGGGRGRGPGGGDLAAWNQRRGPGAPGWEWAATGYPADEMVEPSMDRDEQLAALQEQMTHLTGALESIQQRMDTLAADDQET